MTQDQPEDEDAVTPALLRHARSTYGVAMREALVRAGYDDVPRNGLYVIGGMAVGQGEGVPLAQLVRELRISKQAADQLVDTLVMRGYLARTVDDADRRKLTVALTERGLAAAAVQAKARTSVDDAWIARIGRDEVVRARRALAVLVDLGSGGDDGRLESE